MFDKLQFVVLLALQGVKVTSEFSAIRNDFRVSYGTNQDDKLKFIGH